MVNDRKPQRTTSTYLKTILRCSTCLFNVFTRLITTRNFQRGTVKHTIPESLSLITWTITASIISLICAVKALAQKNLLRVCSHHEFHAQMRNNECINLVCKECCSDYSPPLRPVLRGSDQLVLHAQMYQMSNKYCIVEFEGPTCEKFACACAKIWDTEDFAPTLYIVLSTTPEQGQDIHSVAAQVLNDYLASPSALSSAYSSQRWSPSGVLILI